ncbi:MAG: molybdopterin molybdotransferase MoeA [Candidatus Tectomicrobia bacterium]|nr:molybdopterin molybdotransferase MoeA [Candidatus Tectomicrobia bacterium]
MRPLKELISLGEARGIWEAAAKPLRRTETVSTLQALHRILAQPLEAQLDVPGFARSAMDGYALRSSDSLPAEKNRPLRLRCVERIYTGQVPQRPIRPGECAEIATGAILPEGADAVIMVEQTEAEGDEVLIYQALVPRANVIQRGADIAMGTVVLQEGAFINPSRLGVLCALGVQQVTVYDRPRVAIIPTGGEVVRPGEELQRGQVYDINSYTLASIVLEAGGEPFIHPIVEDHQEKIIAAMESCQETDLFVFSGGSSVGTRDLILDICTRLGEVLFPGIAVKPGKPTLLSTWGEKLILGMPGNPTSCLSNAYMILMPVIRRLGRLPEVHRQVAHYPLSRRQPSTLGRHEFLTVRIANGEAMPVFKSSGDITSMSLADGYIEIAANVDLIEKGERVAVTFL